MLLDWVIYCRGGCRRGVSFWALVGSLALRHSMSWILKSSVTAFLLLKPSGQGLPHYRCNNQREELHVLGGQLWLVWGVSCWLVCSRKLAAWQMGGTACFIVYSRVRFACVYAGVCRALLTSFAQYFETLPVGLRHFVCLHRKIGLAVYACGNVNMGVSWRQVY